MKSLPKHHSLSNLRLFLYIYIQDLWKDICQMILLTTRGMIWRNPTCPPTPNHLPSSAEAQHCTAKGKQRTTPTYTALEDYTWKYINNKESQDLADNFFKTASQIAPTKLKILANDSIIKPQNMNFCQNLLNKVWFLWKQCLHQKWSSSKILKFCCCYCSFS